MKEGIQKQVPMNKKADHQPRPKPEIEKRKYFLCRDI